MGWKDLTGTSILAAMDQMDEGLDELWRQEYGYKPARSYEVSYRNPDQALVPGAEIVFRCGYEHRTLLSIAHHIQFPDSPVILPADFRAGPDLLPQRDVLEQRLRGICPGIFFSAA